VTQIPFVAEPARRVPVSHEVEVAVAGAGVAGCFAAIAAARHGARTLLVDRFGTVGGNIGPGLIVNGALASGQPHPNAPWNCAVYPGFMGLAKEFIERHAALGGETVQPYSRRHYLKDSHIASYVLSATMRTPGWRGVWPSRRARRLVAERARRQATPACPSRRRVHPGRPASTQRTGPGLEHAGTTSEDENQFVRLPPDNAHMVAVMLPDPTAVVRSHDCPVRNLDTGRITAIHALTSRLVFQVNENRCIGPGVSPVSTDTNTHAMPALIANPV